MKFSDYGLAGSEGCVQSQSQDYMYSAPEVFEGKRGPKSDLWSLAITVMELVEGVNPFSGYSEEEVKNALTDGGFPWFRGKNYSSYLKYLLKGCLAVDVERRSSVEMLLKYHFGGRKEIPMMLLKKVRLECMQKEKSRTIANTYVRLFNNGNGRVINEGVIEYKNHQMKEVCKERVVTVDTQSKEVLQVNGENATEIQHNVVLDLDDEGERWEGDVLNDEPCGWGVMYDDENRMVYEGFRMGDVNVCYGRSYYSDIGVVEYEGGWCNGKRWGRGVQYDRSGNTVFDGEWLNDEHLQKRVEVTSANWNSVEINTAIEELCYNNVSVRGEPLCYSFLYSLRLIVIGDDCFATTPSVTFARLPRVERLLIGRHCFSVEDEQDSSVFSVMNCPMLRELSVGSCSFQHYSMCSIKNLPSLETIALGTDCANASQSSFLHSSIELKSGSEEEE